MRISIRAALVVAISLLTSTYVAAEPIHIDLPGNTQFDGWSPAGLTSGANPGYGSFPGTSPWPGSIGSNVAGSGDATLHKVANGAGGGPYPASGSIYYGGFSGDLNVNGGTLAVRDFTPLANLKTVVLQVDIGEAWTYDFFNDALPTLTYNNGTALVDDSLLHANLRMRTETGTVEMPTGTETVYRNDWVFMWDLSGIADSIENFSIEFTGVQHAQLYGLQLDQSDTLQAVPEPSSIALVASAGVGLLIARSLQRRRSKTANVA